ncbi:hypothetical protein GGI25_002507 [Coemansia spiralis]|uniref:Uncharacterized protein n=2 Tax=Coemansia TaxID=4863 RepID=A0A9W8G8N9_9FUNG|nr:hypothetical protein EDC05_000932 [Coemansia umbellata]KAJ2624792.1 hypothetical protein GGI26_001208 [Coemansia sp. RSA 1358]KAJ2678335.1 hypothetical protein GGI25_002507 [Coemansia spiralis]
MSGTDGSKRQRTDDRQSTSTSPEPSISTKAHSSSVPNLPRIEKSETPPMPAPVSDGSQHDLSSRDLLERILTSQERLATDVARLQATMDAVLAILNQPQFGHSYQHHQQMLAKNHQSLEPASTKHPIRDSSPLPSLFPSKSLATDRLSPPAPATSSVISSISLNPQSKYSSIIAEDSSNVSTSSYQSTTSISQSYSHEYYQAGGTRNPASSYYSTPPPPATLAESRLQAFSSSIALPPPAALSLASQPQAQPGHPVIPRLRSPQPVPSYHHQQSRHYQHIAHHQQQQQQLPGSLPPPPTTPISAPPTSSSPFSSARYQPPSQSQSQSQQQPPKKSASRLSHQVHMQYNARPTSASPHRMQHQQQHTEQSVSLPPIIRPPSTTYAQNIGANVYPSSSVRGSMVMPHRQGTPRVPPMAIAGMATAAIGSSVAGAGTSPYSPASSLASSMLVDATPTTAKPSPSPQSATLPGISGFSRGPPPPLNTADSTSTSGMMMEEVRGSSAGVSGSRSNRHHSTQQHFHGPSRSYSIDAVSGSNTVVAQQKVEKNRFQANIRSFVDQYFTVPTNAHWDYQQSFKAPRNAQTTQHVIQAFHAAHGGTYDRIEHGLGVYFSSLKAKHRTTEDKAMLKQQRDRRRARRIKKAAGRRKVFDQAQYPFLPPEFDAQLCFVPAAMSPEHTDDDGEVKVGFLPWRQNTFTKLFRHLDTLRPKRTPRPTNTNLSGGSAPPPDIQSFLIDPEYVAVDRAQEESHDPEEDIEMESSSDGGETRPESAMYM